MKITFFNRYHNGDCFVGKGWVRNIMNQLPDAEFFYAHNRHPDIIKDLGCTYIPIDTINSLGIPDTVRLVVGFTGDIYINTWCGAFQGELFGPEDHSNFIIQHIMYNVYCDALRQVTGLPIYQSENPYDYLPFIDFSFYNTQPADQFVSKLDGRDLIVICNGTSLSGQSNLGNMKNVIDNLSDRFTDKVFVITEDVDIRKNNVFTTDKVFNQTCDLNEIAYLTKFAKLIIGKNSGPSTYSLFHDNLMDSDKTFFCFGTKLTDCPTAGLEFPAKFRFSDRFDDKFVTSMISRVLINTGSVLTGMQHIIL